MSLTFPNSPSVNDTYEFNGLVFVYDGTKWKVDGQLSYIQDAIQFIRSGAQADRPTVNAAALYYNTDLEGLELYYPEIDTWEVISTFAKQVDPTSDSGQLAYTSPGTYSFVCPANVFQVHVVCVGGGGGGWQSQSGAYGGGGGGLAWRNNISVTPGESYTVTVGAGGGYAVSGTDSFFISTSTVCGFGGERGISSASGGTGGNYFTVIGPGGGGFGGNGGAKTFVDGSGGGGGAGGYTGKGGDGGFGPNGNYGQAGSGGGGGGGSCSTQGGREGGGGGGVGLLGQGANGAGAATSAYGQGLPGSGGSGGSNGSIANGGVFGGGGGGYDQYNVITTGGGGAVRIIWGPDRAFPSTNTGDV